MLNFDILGVHVDEASILPSQNNALTHSTKPESEAAIKADLLRQLETASDELATQLDALRNSTSPEIKTALDRGESRLSMLNALRDQLVGGAKGIGALRADISAAIAATHAYTSEARGAAAAQGAVTAQAALQQASAAARGSVADFTRDYYEKRIFDPYLRFASTEDEDAYRRREEERRLAIEKAMAENTPEGTLRASRLGLEQLRDAGAHGADRSPDYQPMLRNFETTGDNLAASLSATGRLSAEREATAADNSTASPAPTELKDAIARFRTHVALADPNKTGHGLDGVGTTRPASGQALPSH